MNRRRFDLTVLKKQSYNRSRAHSRRIAVGHVRPAQRARLLSLHRVQRPRLTHFAFEPTRLSVAGYGEHRPIAPNKTAEGRSLNRRVDIVILSESERQQEPK